MVMCGPAVVYNTALNIEIGPLQLSQVVSSLTPQVATHMSPTTENPVEQVVSLLQEIVSAVVNETKPATTVQVGLSVKNDNDVNMNKNKRLKDNKNRVSGKKVGIRQNNKKEYEKDISGNCEITDDLEDLQVDKINKRGHHYENGIMVKKDEGCGHCEKKENVQSGLKDMLNEVNEFEPEKGLNNESGNLDDICGVWMLKVENVRNVKSVEEHGLNNNDLQEMCSAWMDKEIDDNPPCSNKMIVGMKVNET
ncbi:27581_t:CDS:2 [Dentiscutata erythropus]|uniref:27581_t:CDS:1 n=1 Tax=Dentiscutata erythropus TaxID=1348616 RepID=A0A9N9CIU1_9GLOM|nr:27581_t:CDS:2 [Dentiscutata erythropus]